MKKFKKLKSFFYLLILTIIVGGADISFYLSHKTCSNQNNDYCLESAQFFSHKILPLNWLWNKAVLSTVEFPYSIILAISLLFFYVILWGITAFLILKIFKILKKYLKKHIKS